MTACKGLSPEVGRCLAGVVSDLVDPSATWATRLVTSGENGEDDRVRGWRETVELYVLGVLSCSLAMWKKTRCDDVGWRRWWHLDQWARIFPSELRTNCLHEILRILHWHFIWNASRDLKWESMSGRHRVGRTGREQDKHVFWWEGVARVPSRYSPKTTLLRRPKWSACGRLVGSIHRMTVDFPDMGRSRQSQRDFRRPEWTMAVVQSRRFKFLSLAMKYADRTLPRPRWNYWDRRMPG